MRNYNKISTMFDVEKLVDPEVDIETDESETKTETVGIVSNCGKLNVRKEPNINSDIICEALSKSELLIDLDGSTDEWFKVCTAAGSEGFCMKRFVAIRQ